MEKPLISDALLKYLVAGAAAFSVEYGSFYSLYFMQKTPLYVANSISFGLGLLTSFLLNRLWTFGGQKYEKKSTYQLSYYVILALINLLLTNVLVGLLKYANVSPRIGKLLAMVITSLWNYILFKTIIFRHDKSESLAVQQPK